MEMKIISIYLTQNKHCLECLNGMNKINIHDSTNKIHTCIFRLCSKYPVITRDNQYSENNQPCSQRSNYFLFCFLAKIGRKRRRKKKCNRFQQIKNLNVTVIHKSMLQIYHVFASFMFSCLSKNNIKYSSSHRRDTQNNSFTNQQPVKLCNHGIMHSRQFTKTTNQCKKL